jgi:O-acetyl-ADP-ribose deacetylase (regulator of RNase III)
VPTSCRALVYLTQVPNHQPLVYHRWYRKSTVPRRHAVGPIYGYHDGEEARLLASAYQTCLNLTEQYKLESIAFPSLSTGVYGYPLEEAAPIALGTIIEHIKKPTSLKQVTMVLFGERAYKAFEEALATLL